MLNDERLRDIVFNTPFDILYSPTIMGGESITKTNMHIKYELCRKNMNVGIHYWFSSSNVGAHIEAHVDYRQK